MKEKLDNIIKLPDPPKLNNKNIDIKDNEPKKHIDFFDEKIIIIDSKDRNLDLYPHSNEYSFDL